MRVVDAVAQYFVNEGVEHYFGYIGGTIWPFLDALIDKPQLKGIQPKHEAAAVQMADAYFRLKHKIAPVIVTKGPGVLNTVCALSNAMHDSSAVVLISGAGATQFFDRGGFEEIYYHQNEDTTSVFRPIVKRAWLVVRPEHTLDVMARAFKTALSGRPGPVFVQLPWDIQNTEIDFPVPSPKTLRAEGRVRGDSKAVKRAAELLYSASKPLIVVGGGAMTSEALPEILRLSRNYNAAIVTSLNAKGYVPDTEALSLGQIGRSGSGAANESTREADVVLSVGCRFTDWDTVNWRPNVVFNFPQSKLIHIDIDPGEIGRSYHTEVGIVGDAKATLEDILTVMDSMSSGGQPKAKSWAETIAKRKSDWDQILSKDLLSDASPIHPGRLLNEVRKAAPPNTIFFNDIGDIIQYGQGYLKILEPSTWYINGGMMQMGWAAAAALTGKLLYPDRPCITLLGDGAFLMSSNVVATAVEYNLPAIWIVLNNYGPNLERKAQIGLYGRSHPWGTFSKDGTKNFYNPDFVKIAEACGAKGTNVKTPSEIHKAVVNAINSKTPYVINVDMNRDAPSYFAPGMTRGYPKSWSELAPHL
ncbi:MAG: thiamine pyrophosphate-binding protein [Nitrososphaerota archaeon]|nr:thiamine pyrophosphate-binding protein [Nitrososphaerota archaeon]